MNAIAQGAEEAALVVVFRLVVKLLGGADKARAILDAEYEAVDAAGDAKERAKFGGLT